MQQATCVRFGRGLALATSFTVFALCAFVVAAPPAQPPPASQPATKPKVDPLYEDVTKDDLADLDYWHLKFDMIMADKAVESHQPEGPIAVDLAVTMRELPALIKKYPDRKDLKKWLAHAQEIDKKLDPNADRTKQFKPGFLWDDHAFKQAWVGMHYGKAALAEKDYENAFMQYQNAATNLSQLLTIEDRMEDWPEEAIQWVKDSKPIADAKRDELGKKTHHL